MGYKIKKPKYIVGQHIIFINNNKDSVEGEIMSVVTHYSQKHKNSKWVSYHIYHIKDINNKKNSYIGERNIISKK